MLWSRPPSSGLEVTVRLRKRSVRQSQNGYYEKKREEKEDPACRFAAKAKENKIYTYWTCLRFIKIVNVKGKNTLNNPEWTFTMRMDVCFWIFLLMQ